MNFDHTKDCSSAGGGSILYDEVMGTVSNELGLPPELSGILTGRTSVGDLFESVLLEELGKIGIGTNGGQTGSELGGLIGKRGLPDPTNLLDQLLVANKNTGLVKDPVFGGIPVDSSGGKVKSPNIFTPTVNASLMQPVLALDILTRAVTDKGLSAKGQDATQARSMASQASARMSGQIGEKSIESAENQLKAAVEMDETVREQTSTQDTLKEALTGINMLNAQSTRLEAEASNQRALAAQIDTMNLQATHEMRDGVFATGLSLKQMNKQMMKEASSEMAEDSSMRTERDLGLRMMGAYR